MRRIEARYRSATFRASCWRCKIYAHALSRDQCAGLHWGPQMEIHLNDPRTQRIAEVPRHHRRLRLIATMFAGALLIGCGRAPDRIDKRTAAAVAASAPAQIQVASGLGDTDRKLATVTAVHIASSALDVTKEMRNGPTDTRLYFQIPGLAQGPNQKAFSLSYPGSKHPVTDYPNTWLLRSPRGGLCVATSIGPRSILTAAHCVTPGVLYALKQGEQQVQARCVRMAGYSDPADPDDCSVAANRAADLAVCTVIGEGKLAVPGGRYETVDIMQPKAQGEIEVVTFTACFKGVSTDVVNPVHLTIDTWPQPGILNTAAAVGTPPLPLCPRDSGGPWLSTSQRPSLVAVHVCLAGNHSLGVALDTAEVVDFLKSQDGNNSPLCGLSATSAICR